MLGQILSNRVEKTPATEVSADRYQFLTLSEAEPDLGVPSANGYILSSSTTGTRSWLDPATDLIAPGNNSQVIFNNAGFLAGAVGLVYDVATGRIGVGADIPSAKLDVVGDIQVNSNVNLNSESISLSSTTQTQIASVSVSAFRSGKFIVQSHNSETGEVQVSELLVVHNGATASATEYGVVYTGAKPLASYDVDINNGSIQLLATGTSSNLIEYKIGKMFIIS